MGGAIGFRVNCGLCDRSGQPNSAKLFLGFPNVLLIKNIFFWPILNSGKESFQNRCRWAKKNLKKLDQKKLGRRIFGHPDSAKLFFGFPQCVANIYYFFWPILNSGKEHFQNRCRWA